VIEDATEKFNFFGTRPVIGAVVNDEYRLALITCQSVEDAVKTSPGNQQEPPPIVGARFEQVVCRILSDIRVIVDDNATEEIMPDERQCENCFCQRTNAVAVAFTDATSVEQSTNVELVEKVVNLVKDLDVRLRSGGDPAMVHLSPFCLILL
jgi:hypothetical protein